MKVVRLNGSGGRDGEWLRVRQYGFWTADVRTVAELAQWFPLDVAGPRALRTLTRQRKESHAMRKIATGAAAIFAAFYLVT